METSALLRLCLRAVEKHAFWAGRVLVTFAFPLRQSWFLFQANGGKGNLCVQDNHLRITVFPFLSFRSR